LEIRECSAVGTDVPLYAAEAVHFLGEAGVVEYVVLGEDLILWVKISSSRENAPPVKTSSSHRRTNALFSGAELTLSGVALDTPHPAVAVSR
jgi:hypothetical protein